MSFDKNFFSETEKLDRDEVFTVSQLNQQARNLLEENFRSIWVEGEASNLHISSAGHLYFTLKEEGSEIDAVMFDGDRKQLDFEPADGMALLVNATLTIYERRGRYQLRVRDLKKIGRGELEKKFQQLKERLKNEGLFEEDHKQKLPNYPSSLALITSPTGAAIKDMVFSIEERFPSVSCYLFPVKVQGEGAGKQIAQAIKRANELSSKMNLEAIILSRGGGSLEDLWPFNEEVVARAIFNSELPVVSGVGHEVDFTITDFVADVRVPTPTAVGKEVVPDQREIKQKINLVLRRMIELESTRIREFNRNLEHFLASLGFRLPFRKLEDLAQDYDRLSEKLIRTGNRSLSEKREIVESLIEKLSIANPTRLLKNGYSVTYGKDGEVVTSFESVQKGDSLKIVPYKGIIRSVVTGAEEGERRKRRTD